MVLEVEPTSKTSIDSITPMIEPLIDESEPVKHLGAHSIQVVDPSRPFLNSELVDDMAEMTLSAGDSVSGVKPFSEKEQELMRDLPRRECAYSISKAA